MQPPRQGPLQCDTAPAPVNSRNTRDEPAAMCSCQLVQPRNAIHDNSRAANELLHSSNRPARSPSFVSPCDKRTLPRTYTCAHLNAASPVQRSVLVQPLPVPLFMRKYRSGVLAAPWVTITHLPTDKLDGTRSTCTTESEVGWRHQHPGHA